MKKLPPIEKGVDSMISYEAIMAFLTFGILVVAIISLCIDRRK